MGKVAPLPPEFEIWAGQPKWGCVPLPDWFPRWPRLFRECCCSFSPQSLWWHNVYNRLHRISPLHGTKGMEHTFFFFFFLKNQLLLITLFCNTDKSLHFLTKLSLINLSFFHSLYTWSTILTQFQETRRNMWSRFHILFNCSREPVPTHRSTHRCDVVNIGE